VSNVHSQEVTACFTLVFAANHVSRVLLKGSKEIRNIGTHTANQTCDGYGTMVGRLLTTPLSPDIAPSDFKFLILPTKPLIGKQFATDADVKQAVTSWLQIYENDFFYNGTQVLVPPQWDNCLNVNGTVIHVQCIQQSQNRVLGISV